MLNRLTLAALGAATISFTPLAAQDSSQDQALPQPGQTIFDGDYVSAGLGVGMGPSYTGSDDYVVFPLPVVQARIGDISVTPRAAGAAVSYTINTDSGPTFLAGVVGTLNLSRANRISDPVVEAAGELDTAVQVGPTVGARFSGVLNPYDAVSLNLDAQWDVAGAHDGFTLSPGVTYFTPVSRAAAAALNLNARYVDNDFSNYYYSVSTGQALASGLPRYRADSGFDRAGASLIFGYDLDGELANGGLVVLGIAGYSRLFGDAQDTPYTRIRGSADQFFGGIGLAYTFGI